MFIGVIGVHSGCAVFGAVSCVGFITLSRGSSDTFCFLRFFGEVGSLTCWFGCSCCFLQCFVGLFGGGVEEDGSHVFGVPSYGSKSLLPPKTPQSWGFLI